MRFGLHRPRKARMRCLLLVLVLERGIRLNENFVLWRWVVFLLLDKITKSAVFNM